MADRLETLGSLVQDVDHELRLAATQPTLLAADAAAYVKLSNGWSGKPGAPVARIKASEQQLDELLEKLRPPPSNGPTTDEVKVALEHSIGGPGNLVAAVDLLAKLHWTGKWEVLEYLRHRAPGLDSRTYLELFVDEIQQLPNVDPRASAAVLAAALSKGTRTLKPNDAAAWIRLAEYLLVLDIGSQMEILGWFGVPPEATEGAMALMISEQLEREEFSPQLTPAPRHAAAPRAAGPPAWFHTLKGLWNGINVNADTFLDFNKPKDMPYGYYLGTQIHIAIAAYYKTFHATHLVWANVTPVLSILGALQTKFAFTGSGLGSALAASRPDIFEFGFVHGMPPGWVYEIKPASYGEGLAKAEYEVLFYATALTLCDIPAIPGPVTANGVKGVVPTVGGWVAFMCPIPGAIVYYYRAASKEALAKRARVPATHAARVSTEEWVRLSGQAADIAAVGLLAAIVAILLESGWILVFA